jgi:hypothetical protein
MLISYYFDEEENHPISVEVFKRLESMGEEDIYFPANTPRVAFCCGQKLVKV